MRDLKSIKKFGGVEMIPVSTHGTKVKANHHAKTLRKRGNNARVMPLPKSMGKGWEVWTGKPKRKRSR